MTADTNSTMIRKPILLALCCLITLFSHAAPYGSQSHSGSGGHHSAGSHSSSTRHYSSGGSHLPSQHSSSFVSTGHSGYTHSFGHVSTGSHRTSHSSYHSTSTHRKTYSTGATRNSHGKIKRSSKARYEFMKQTGYPHGRKGYVIDHIIPLKKGGCDCPSNMQWQTIQDAKAKDKWECP